MADFLIPGSVVPKSGIYRINHSSGHRPDAEVPFFEGLVLPSCFHEGCHVSYMLVRIVRPASEDPDFKAIA
jgi:hypothetical protein